MIHYDNVGIDLDIAPLTILTSNTDISTASLCSAIAEKAMSASLRSDFSILSPIGLIYRAGCLPALYIDKFGVFSVPNECGNVVSGTQALRNALELLGIKGQTLSPLHSYLLILERPETGLSIRSQRLLARSLTRAVNDGHYCFISTRSDIILAEINCMLGAHKILQCILEDGTDELWLEDVHPADAISFDNVIAYEVTAGHSVIPVERDRAVPSLLYTSIDEDLGELHDLQQAIVWSEVWDDRMNT